MRVINRKLAYDHLCCLLAPTNPYAGLDLDPEHPLWPVIFSVADQNFVLPELHQSIAHKGLLDALPALMRESLDEVTRLLEKRTVRLKAQMDEINAGFAQAGILPVWLKGAALLSEPLWEVQPRIMSDLDLWVPQPEQQDLALTVLGTLGYRAKPDAVLSDWGDSHHYAPMFHPQQPVSLELHRHIVRKALGPLLPDAVAAGQLEHIMLNGLPAARLSLGDRIMHSLIQASLMSTPPIETGQIRLMKMVDLARLLARDGTHEFSQNVTNKLTDSLWQVPIGRFLTLFERDFLVTNPLGNDVAYCEAVDYLLNHGRPLPKIVLRQLLQPPANWHKFLSQPRLWPEKLARRFKFD